MKKILQAGVAAMVLAVSANGAALAATVDGVWSTAAPPNTAGLNGVGSAQMNWGIGAIPGQQSGYGFVGEDLSGVTPLDTVFTIGTFTHRNRPIYTLTDRPSSITGATLAVSIALNLGNGVTQMLSSVFDFDHWETPNRPPSGQACANGGALGSGVNVFGCADRVTATRNNGLSESIQIGDLIYELDITGFLFNGVALTEFWTVEGLSNSAILQGIVRTRIAEGPGPGPGPGPGEGEEPPPPAPIPLPAAGWLLIAALGGLAAARRRRP